MFEEFLGLYILLVAAVLVTMVCVIVGKQLWDDWRN